MIKLTLEIDGNEFVYEVTEDKLDNLLESISDTTDDNLDAAESAESLLDLCRDTGLDYEEVVNRLKHLPDYHLNAIQ